MATLHTFKTKKRLDYGTMYFFRYNHPVTKNIKVWDKAPLCIPLYFDSKILLAINIHWVPARLRKKFIATVLELSDTIVKRGQTKRLVRIYYDMFKNGPLKWAIMGIRKYYINRITNIQDVPPEFWGQLNPSDGKYKSRIHRVNPNNVNHQAVKPVKRR